MKGTQLAELAELVHVAASVLAQNHRGAMDVPNFNRKMKETA